ncbi:hypothetical protein CS779_08245 [Campylobacter upsaliensis]|nr:hypothetical protein [Campylobacter upsaliensis]
MCGGGARSSKVKQGQARSSRVKQGQACGGEQTRLKRHDKFTPNGKANSRQKAKPNLAKPKKLFLKAKSQKIGAKRYIGAKLNLVS